MMVKLLFLFSSFVYFQLYNYLCLSLKSEKLYVPTGAPGNNSRSRNKKNKFFKEKIDICNFLWKQIVKYDTHD